MWTVRIVTFNFLFLFFFFFLPCHTVYGILVPRPGIKPAPPAFKVQSLNHWTAREVPRILTLYSLILRIEVLSSFLKKNPLSAKFVFLYGWKWLIVIFHVPTGNIDDAVKNLNLKSIDKEFEFWLYLFSKYVRLRKYLTLFFLSFFICKMRPIIATFSQRKD